MVDYAERGRATEKRHSAAKHRQRGVGRKDPALEAGKRVERSHSDAKHKARFRLPEAERTAMDDDEYADWRKKYYREARPDLDPQSTTSKVLEFFGQDPDPYARDARSYDYRKEAFDDSVKQGNPDMSWFLPEMEWTDDQTVDARYPIDTMSEEEANYTAQRLHDRFVRDNGREPTESEWGDIVQRNFDPRSRAEKNAGAGMEFSPLAFFGAEDESTAAAMSALRGTTYDDELEKARAIQQRYEMFENPLSWRNIGATGGQLAGAFGGPVAATWRGAELGVKGARAALGLAPEATTALGRAVSTVASGAPAGATDFALMDFGAGEGGFENRLKNIDPSMAAAGAVAGGVTFPILGALGSKIAAGGRKAVGGAGRLAKRVLKRADATPRGWNYTPTDVPPPPPARGSGGSRTPAKLPGVDGRPTKIAGGSVRGDINRAFRSRAAPPPRGGGAGMGVAAAATGAGATGAIGYDIATKKKRRKRYDGS